MGGRLGVSRPEVTSGERTKGPPGAMQAHDSAPPPG